MKTEDLLDLLQETDRNEMVSLPSLKARDLIIEVLRVRNDATVHQTAFKKHIAQTETSHVNKAYHADPQAYLEQAQREYAKAAPLQDALKRCVEAAPQEEAEANAFAEEMSVAMRVNRKVAKIQELLECSHERALRIFTEYSG
jgi:hypothetical protein